MSHPLVDYRAKHGLTQQEMAARLKVSKSAVSRWEARIRVPGPEQLLKIAQMTGADLAALLSGQKHND